MLPTPSEIATAMDWPTFGQSVLAWLAAAGVKIAQIGAIIVIGIALSWLVRILIRRIVNRIVNGAKSRANVTDTQSLERSPLAQVRIVQRTRTLGSILQNVVNVTIVVVVIVLIVVQLAPAALSSLTLLTAAIGAGLGFGAQNIVKDVLNGIFIVAEDQVGIGDVVDLGLATGIVEYVSVRVTHVRDVNGTLWYVRNGEITRIGNMSQGWSRAILDVGLPADADIAEVESLLLEVATGIAKDPKWRTRILDAPEVWGLESTSGESLVIRVVMKARPNAKDDVARELRMRVKRAIETQGMTTPALTAVVLSGAEGAQRVRGANPPRTKPNPVAPDTDQVPARPIWRPQRTADQSTEESS